MLNRKAVPQQVPLEPAEVAEILKERHSEILLDWENRVRTRFPEANGKDRFTLRNSVPGFLKWLAESVVKPDAETAIALKTIGHNHGTQRFLMRDYSLEVVIREYSCLLSAVFRAIEDSGELGQRERERIIDSFDLALGAAAKEFVRRHSESLRTEQATRSKLEQESKQKDEALAYVSHDLRNPLTAIRLLASLIQADPLTQEHIRFFASEVLANLDRSEEMIHEILEIQSVRIQEGDARAQAEADVAEILTTTVRHLEPIYGKRFRVQGDSSVRGKVSKKQVMRAVENLLVNAIKYGEADSQIDVRYGHEGDYVWISVHNEGPPIPETAFPTLFMPFHRVPDASKGSTPGWGLGLAYVKAVADAHQGDVSIESAADIGTTVKLKLCPSQESRSANKPRGSNP